MAISPSVQCYFTQNGNDGKGNSVPQHVFVLQYDNPNSFTINVPKSTGSANPDGSYNEIDYVVYGSSVSYNAAYSSQLPVSFAQGAHRNAGAVLINDIDEPKNNASTFAWYTITPGQINDEYNDFQENPSDMAGISSGTETGSENTAPIAFSDLGACSAADADAIRRMIARR